MNRVRRSRPGAAITLGALLMQHAWGATPDPSRTINANNVHQAEARARSAEDHRKIAAYYERQAELIQAKLAEAEDLVKYWASAAASNDQVTTPYWSAKQRADQLRSQLNYSSAREAEQQKLAQPVH